MKIGSVRVRLFGFVLLLCVASAAAERPNIIFIMTDDHAVQATSAYGSTLIETPNIDRIANNGMRFDRAYVANSICGPSRATMLTGTHSHVNGFYLNNLRPFDGEQPNVAKLLRNAGYQTALIGKWHLESDPTGFDHWEVLSDMGGQGKYYDANFATPNGEIASTGYVSTVITDKALNWLNNNRDAQTPFFLVYQHKAPHRGFVPGPEEFAAWDDAAKVAEPPTLFDDYSGRAKVRKEARMRLKDHIWENDVKYVRPDYAEKGELKASWDENIAPGNASYAANPLTGDERLRWIYQRYIKSYLATVASTDREIGRLLDYLETSGLDANTLVIYTSDQGFYLGEHGWFDKRWIDEESARIPLVVQWPGRVAPGSTNGQLVQNLDFAQTILDAAGVPAHPRMQGMSFKPLLEGEKPAEWRDALYYHYYEYPGIHNAPKHYGVITDRYKLIHYYQHGEWELFDLSTDPDELRSEYDNPRYAEIRGQLLQKLTQLRAQYQVPDEDEAPNWWQARIGDWADRLMNYFWAFE